MNDMPIKFFNNIMIRIQVLPVYK